jgi:hypothetical protein
MVSGALVAAKPKPLGIAIISAARLSGRLLACFRRTLCDPFGIPLTSHWMGAAIIVQ